MDADYDRTIGEFVDKIRNVGDLDPLRAIFNETATSLGFRYFTYHIVRVPGLGSRLPYVVTTYPESWVTHYITEGYVHVDPVLIQGPKSVVPFNWNEVARPVELSEKQSRLFHEAHDYGIADGMSVPIHGPNGEYASMSLVADGGGREAELTTRRYRHLMHLLSLYYHNHTGSILIEKHLPTAFPELTDRERECLQWVSKGKTTWDISAILNIAERTVIFHIENAKKKLGVYSRSHAVVKAIMLGLIDY